MAISVTQRNGKKKVVNRNDGAGVAAVIKRPYERSMACGESMAHSVNIVTSCILWRHSDIKLTAKHRVSLDVIMKISWLCTSIESSGSGVAVSKWHGENNNAYNSMMKAADLGKEIDVGNGVCGEGGVMATRRS